VDAEQSEEFDHEKDLQRRLSQFQQLENEFLQRYSDAKNSLFPKETADGQRQLLQSIHDALDSLDEPSNIVTKMVSESRVLHGLGHADSTEIEGMLNVKGDSTTAAITHKDSSDDDGKIEVHLRQGCETTLARILLSHSTPHQQPPDDFTTETSCLGWSLAVLSINWCPALIDASLVQPVLRKKRSLLNQQHCETEVPIWSNNVDEEGVVTLHVPGALAKRDKIVELRNRLEYLHNSAEESKARNKHLIVYVGDSSTDLAALLEADIGIIMGNSSSTRSIAERWGIVIFSLQNRHEHGFDAGLKGMPDTEDRPIILWQAESWQEIDEMLEELDANWE
jgi:hypothetical protein